VRNRGTKVALEATAAAVLRNLAAPELRVRAVDVTDLIILSGALGSRPRPISDIGFENLFTRDKKSVVNYHGHPRDMVMLVVRAPPPPAELLLLKDPSCSSGFLPTIHLGFNPRNRWARL